MLKWMIGIYLSTSCYVANPDVVLHSEAVFPQRWFECWDLPYQARCAGSSSSAMTVFTRDVAMLVAGLLKWIALMLRR